MTLDILVPHYKEPWAVIEPLLDSIKVQGGINHDDIQVLIGHDGKDMEFNEILFTDYPFKIKQYTKKHEGVSACRNYLLDKSKADYVCFCDADDMWLNNYGLHVVFQAMGNGFDAITSLFLEEHKLEDGSMKLVQRDNDATFVHGKIYKREYLVKENIRFDPDLTIHEDGYFNCLAMMCTDNKYHITTPIYLWKWRDGSVAQKGNNNFTLETYAHVMKTRQRICRQVKERGYINEFYNFVITTVVDSYYDFNKNSWKEPANAELVKAAEKEFKKFYDEFGSAYKECNAQQIAEQMVASRNRAYVGGMRIESITLADWLNHIVKDV